VTQVDGVTRGGPDQVPPGAEIIHRDGAGCYAEGATARAPPTSAAARGAPGSNQEGAAESAALHRRA